MQLCRLHLKYIKMHILFSRCVVTVLMHFRHIISYEFSPFLFLSSLFWCAPWCLFGPTEPQVIRISSEFFPVVSLYCSQQQLLYICQNCAVYVHVASTPQRILVKTTETSNSYITVATFYKAQEQPEDLSPQSRHIGFFVEIKCRLPKLVHD